MKFPDTIAFINPKSGGKHGSKLYLKLCVILGEDHVFDLSRGGPEAGLRKYCKCENLKVIACGGDGTVGWIHSCIDKIKFASPPAVVPFPLGTGNDMSRVLGWGANYAGEAVVPRLEDIESATPIKMDRWTITSEPLEDEDLVLLKTLLCSCDKAFSDDSSSSQEEPTPVRTFSAPPRGQTQTPPPSSESPSTSNQSQIVPGTNTPPPSWMSSRRLRFNTVSEIPNKPRRGGKDASASSLSNSLETSEHESTTASSSSSSSLPPNSKDPESTSSVLPNPNSDPAVSTANGLSPATNEDEKDDTNETKTPRGKNQTSSGKIEHDGSIESTLLGTERPVLDTDSVEWKKAMATQEFEQSVTVVDQVASEPVIEDSTPVEDSPPTPKTNKKKKKSRGVLAQSDGHIVEEKRERSHKKRRVVADDSGVAAVPDRHPSPSDLTLNLNASEGDLATPSAPERPGSPEPTMQRPDFRKIRSTSSLKSSSIDLAERRALVMNNYFSLGVDSMVALEFHNKREASPTLFPHHMINKAWYGVYGLKHCLLNLSKQPELRRVMRLELDGVEVEIPKGVQAIVLLQIPSYSSGTNVWGDPKKEKGQKSPPMVSDGLFEVVGLKGVMHLGALQAGWSSGLRLGQASRAVLYNICVVPVQCDGEPWLLAPCKTVIEFQNQSTMLFNVNLGQSTAKRFRTVTGQTLPSMVDPATPENDTEAGTSQESATESSSSDFNASDLRADLRDAGASAFKSTHDIPARVRAASKAITRSYDSLPALPPQQPDSSAVEAVAELSPSPSKKRRN